MSSCPGIQQSSEPPVSDAEILNLDRFINILDFLNVSDFNTVRKNDPLCVNIRIILQPLEARMFSAWGRLDTKWNVQVY